MVYLPSGVFQREQESLVAANLMHPLLAVIYVFETPENADFSLSLMFSK